MMMRNAFSASRITVGRAVNRRNYTCAKSYTFDVSQRRQSNTKAQCDMIIAEMRKFHNLNCLPDSNQNQNPNLGIWGRCDTL